MCNHQFDNNDANVACYMLGFGYFVLVLLFLFYKRLLDILGDGPENAGKCRTFEQRLQLQLQCVGLYHYRQKLVSL